MSLDLKIPVAIAILVVAVGPTMARQQRIPAPGPAISTYCATIEPGNPHSKVYDYQAWSAWRARGLWDSTGSDRCLRNPLYSPPGTPTFRPIPFPNPSWF